MHDKSLNHSIIHFKDGNPLFITFNEDKIYVPTQTQMMTFSVLKFIKTFK